LPNDFFLNPTRHSYSHLASTPQALSSFILHTSYFLLSPPPPPKIPTHGKRKEKKVRRMKAEV
jgi:hypothetical protein